MTEAAVGMVGGGRIARILLGGWTRANGSPPDIVVSDSNPESLNRLKAEFPPVGVTQDNREAARRGVVLFGLHPPAFASVLAECRQAVPAVTIECGHRREIRANSSAPRTASSPSSSIVAARGTPRSSQPSDS